MADSIRDSIRTKNDSQVATIPPRTKLENTGLCHPASQAHTHTIQDKIINFMTVTEALLLRLALQLAGPVGHFGFSQPATE